MEEQEDESEDVIVIAESDKKTSEEYHRLEKGPFIYDIWKSFRF